MPRRLAFAHELQAGFAPGGQYAKAWRESLPEIRAAYPGLDLKPQMGLLPIGSDPESKLWEFAHLLTGDPAVRGALERMPRSDVPLPFVLAAIGVPVLDRVKDEAPAVRAPRSFSLAVVQKCNLGCTYCYAQEGEFGAQPAHMSQETAFASVDRLFNEVSAGERVNLAFMGGEPMLNRSLVRRATEYAVRTAEERGAQVGFSITTNGTLLTADDAAFFERYAFAVTVSLDGVGEAHDLDGVDDAGLDEVLVDLGRRVEAVRALFVADDLH